MDQDLKMADSTSQSHRCDYSYDVFLSFRGADTRTNFVHHLRDALVRAGIQTFEDDDTETSISISEELSKTIEESRCAIVVFSKAYAASSRCLDELAKIMECNKKTGQLVLPIFYYDFKPLYLQRRGSVFGELFGRHEIKKAREWTEALVQAANLSGRNLIDYRDHAKCIEEIIETVSRNLNFTKSSFHQSLMGMEHKKSRLMTSRQENLVGIERTIREVKYLLEGKAGKIASKSSLASSPLPSRPPTSCKWKYDVFMSFRDNDTCNGFGDQLWHALDQRGIYTLPDNHGPAKGEPSEHLEIIEESFIAVVIFSKHYAASPQCLDELVKIMYCNQRSGQIVLPVFYDVEASDVRNQKGFFGETLMSHKPEKLKVWRKALVEACSLAGWYLNCTPKRLEASTMENIIDVISRRLTCSHIDDSLIGIGPRVNRLRSMLKVGLDDDVQVIGIWGMGGIGKTTLARAVSDKVSGYFDGSCFIENIGEISRNHGLGYLQKGCTKDNRRVLIVLDGADRVGQIEALAGSYSTFGKGSRILLTTRDKHLLLACNVAEIYHVDLLSDNESMQFLKRHAFKKDDFIKEYEDVMLQVVRYAAGLPLALMVLSKLLCGKSKKAWTSTLARLEKVPEKKIEDSLKVSYDSLDSNCKELFLDIACFFNGKEKDSTVEILESFGHAEFGVTLLEEKSIIRIVDGRIQMHHLLQKMGWDIVLQSHPDEPGKHSRLWHPEDGSDVLMEKGGTKEITPIVVDYSHSQKDVDMIKAFKRMPNLKQFQFRSKNESSYLPRDLQWLTWEKINLQFLPSLQSLTCLHVLDLSNSKLKTSPDFSGLPNLEKLNLSHCTHLVKIHPSIGSLKRLTFLNLERCENLLELPQSIRDLSSLEILDLTCCLSLSLTYIPDLPKQLKYLFSCT